MEVAGQIGLDSRTGKLVEGIEQQTKQTLENIKNILSESGWTCKDVIKVRIYLTNMKDYDKVNKIYITYFSKDPPARVALAVKALPFGALIEIECSAARNKVKPGLNEKRLGMS